MVRVETITPIDLRRSLGRILDQASAGERFMIERDHHPLAVLISVEDAARLDEDPGEAMQRRLAAIDALEEWRHRVLGTPHMGAGRASAADAVRADRDARDRRDRARASRSQGNSAGDG